MKTFTYFIVLLLLLGCAKKGPLEKPGQERSLRIAFHTQIPSLNPSLGKNYPMNRALLMLFDGLFRKGPEGDLEPSIAQSYEISDDGLTYTFYLRDSCWSDGAPLTAHDFEYSWKKSVDPKSGCLGASCFYVIKNGKGCIQGSFSKENLGVKAIDRLILQVELEHPLPYFRDFFADTALYPIPMHLDSKGIDWASRKDETFVSNGPFRMQEWKQTRNLKLVKNESYWDEKRVKLPAIDISFIENGATIFHLYKKGYLDWFGEPVNSINTELISELSNDPHFSTLDVTSLFWFVMNAEKFPFTNEKIRKAFALAINRKEIVKHLLYGQGSVAQGVLAPSFELNQSPYFDDGNIHEAQRFFQEGMEELGLTLETFPQIKVSYGDGRQVHHSIVQEVQQCWQKAFNIPITLLKNDWPIHCSQMQKGNYQMGFIGWGTSNRDPIYMLRAFKYKNDANNDSNWENPHYQKLLDLALYERDSEKRTNFLLEAEAFLMNEMPVIPVYFLKLGYVTCENLKGYTLSFTGGIDFKFAYFKQSGDLR